MIGDYWRLTRPGIVAMVLFATAVAAWIAGEHPPAFGDLAHALLGTALVIVGAVSLNQRIEFRGDARMARTALRPLPAGRLTDRQVTRFGLATSIGGFAYLWLFSSAGVLVVAVASWIVYVAAYTPLKSVTAWQTPIGALAGAMPVVLGAAVVRAPMSPTTATLFGIVYFWQFPHAMAIAWLYRDQFAEARVKLSTVLEPSGRRAALLAVAGAAALLPISLVPLFRSIAGWPYAVVTVPVGVVYLAVSLRFLMRRDDRTARWMLQASLVYLPIVLVALVWQGR